MEKSKVFFTKEITSENLIKIYETLGQELKGKVAVKLSTGEAGGHYFLNPNLIKDLIHKVNGTIVECNTAYSGKTSIQIDSLMTVLGNNIFKNKRVFSQRYIVEEEKGILKNFSVMPIMDLDDTSEDRKQKYISKEMFKKHWLNSYIIPIWNNSNLDEVLLDLKLINKLPNNKEKGRVYRGLFPTNKGESDKQQVENLMKMFEKSNKTNMEVFIKKCLDSI